MNFLEEVTKFYEKAKQKSDKEVKMIKQALSKIAERNGLKVTDRLDSVSKAKQMLLGEEWICCPCETENKDRYCGSKVCLEEIQKKGVCHCGLFERGEEELNPCPFCGKNDVVISMNGELHCLDCGAFVDFLDDNGKTNVEGWNARPIEDAKDKEIKRLREALEVIHKAMQDDPIIPAIERLAYEALKGGEE